MGRNVRREVAVIGAGATGLTAAKALLEAGLVPTVFEKTAHLGGIWTFDEAAPDGGSPAYRSLHTNTVKQITAFSDFPFRTDLPDFPPAAAVVAYLHDYAVHFGLLEHIRFKTTVDSVSPADGSRWNVTVSSAAGTEMKLFDAVYVCSGMFHEPLIPNYPGLESFGGKLLHSRHYADAAPFVGQRVLVVGVGNSGVDIAVECGDVARQVLFSGRNGTWTSGTGEKAPRPGSSWNSRLWRNLRLSLGPRPTRAKGSAARPDAPFVMWRDRLIINDKLRKSLASGVIIPKPDVSRIAGNTVHFEDGTSATVDTIICATGYTLHFPFIDQSIFRVTPDGLGLYRALVHPDYPTLAILGMSRATGAIMPFAEMQARWMTAVLHGKIKLPPLRVQWAQIEARRKNIVARNGNPFRIEFEPYADMLAAELGVLPRLWRHPLLLRDLLFGKPIAARYRLDGPYRWPDAARVIRDGNFPPAQPAREAEPLVRDSSWSQP